MGKVVIGLVFGLAIGALTMDLARPRCDDLALARNALSLTRSLRDCEDALGDIQLEASTFQMALMSCQGKWIPSSDGIVDIPIPRDECPPGWHCSHED